MTKRVSTIWTTVRLSRIDDGDDVGERHEARLGADRSREQVLAEAVRPRLRPSCRARPPACYGAAGMTDDPNRGATPPEAPGASRMGRGADAARLFTALQSRPGHALVVADDAASAEVFFERVDAQLVCQRRVRLAGAGLDHEAMIAALGADIRGPHRPRSSEAILSMVATEACAAGLPILVIITGAEDVAPATLERIGGLIESVPDARAAAGGGGGARPGGAGGGGPPRGGGPGGGGGGPPPPPPPPRGGGAPPPPPRGGPPPPPPPPRSPRPRPPCPSPPSAPRAGAR